MKWGVEGEKNTFFLSIFSLLLFVSVDGKSVFIKKRDSFAVLRVAENRIDWW